MKKYVLLLTILGILDSIYLTIEHFVPQALLCPKIGIIDCGLVLSSQYSEILGIPIAFMALIWFFIYYALNEQTYTSERLKIAKNIWRITGFGGIFYSLNAQYALNHICIYCNLLDILIALLITIPYFEFKKLAGKEVGIVSLEGKQSASSPAVL